MDLLPHCHKEFRSHDYWDKFFKKRGTTAFEWYGEYPKLCAVLHKYIKPAEKLLVVGCGNSQLSADMYDVGYQNIVNIDISDVVIRQMTNKNQQQRPLMKFLKMNVKKMDFADGEYRAVIDKGTLDSLMVDESEAVSSDIDAMFSEISRVLKFGGRLVIISLLQDHILRKILNFFSEMCCPVRIHKVETESLYDNKREFHMPVFAVIVTKFKKLCVTSKQILEVVRFENKVERFETIEEMITVVKEMWHYCLIRHQLNKSSVFEEQMCLHLYSSSSDMPRYALYIVDSMQKKANSFGIFIVPQGREREYLFSADGGRKQLSESAKFERLIVVLLQRGHSYENLDSIKAELSSKVIELAPSSYKPDVQVPFLSIGEEIGERTVIYQGSSEISGDFVVEDVQTDGKLFRRLIFLSNQNVIQTEILLDQERQKKRKGKKNKSLVINKSYLSCQHHIAVVAGFSFVENLQASLENGFSILVIGLGGGALPSFLHKHFPKVSVDVVDIDPAILTVATNWFGFKEDKRMKAYITNGIDFIHKQAGKGSKYHAVLFDVDAKDNTVNLQCPPKVFVEEEVLIKTRQILYPEGMLILNLGCREEQIVQSIITVVKKVFRTVYRIKTEEEINELVYAFPNGRQGILANKDDKKLPDKITECLEVLTNSIKFQADNAVDMDLTEALVSLTLG